MKLHQNAIFIFKDEKISVNKKCYCMTIIKMSVIIKKINYSLIWFFPSLFPSPTTVINGTVHNYHFSNSLGKYIEFNISKIYLLKGVSSKTDLNAFKNKYTNNMYVSFIKKRQSPFPFCQKMTKNIVLKLAAQVKCSNVRYSFLVDW